MDVIKTSSNVCFDVIYADGTKHRVKEGVLFGVEDEAIVFHNGTSRLSVLIAAAEAAMEVLDLLGKTIVFAKSLHDSPPDSPGRIAFLKISKFFEYLHT